MVKLVSGWLSGGSNMMPWIFVFLTVAFTVYGQIVVKWQVGQMGELPDGLMDKVIFVFSQYLNPWIMSGLASAFLASACWIVAMTRLDLSVAYPFMSLAFVIVLFLSAVFFSEALSINKAIGTVIILVGLFVIIR